MPNTDFLTYLRTYQGPKVFDEREDHAALRREIEQNPRVVGIREEIVGCYTLVPILDGDHQITIIGLVVATEEAFYLIEVSSNRKKAHYNVATDRLHSSYRYLNRVFGVSPYMLIAFREDGRIKREELSDRLTDALGMT